MACSRETQQELIRVGFEVPHDLSGLRLDQFLAARLHRHSRAKIRRLIEAGKVLFRGKGAKASTRVSQGESVFIFYPKREDPPSRHDGLPVIYEDACLLAVNKPGYVLSHPTDKIIQNSATHILSLQFPGRSLHLAHRLDRETSGVLLLAKTKEAAAFLNREFQERRVRKEYWAIVHGRAGFRKKSVSLAIGPAGRDIRVRQAAGSDESFRDATTEFARLAANDEASLLCAAPRTGRLHQIRVHLAALGHPIVGDKLYNGGGKLYMKAFRRELLPEDLLEAGAPRQMLHARKMELAHPESGLKISLTAPLPEDFLDCLRRKGLPADLQTPAAAI